MKRGEIGRYETTRIAGESVCSFSSHPQNWIGGTRPGKVRFGLSPPTAVPDCMAALKRFIYAEGDGMHPLIRIAFTHLQFETIHPFLDGNCRTGRNLIVWQLCQSGVIGAPLRPLSTYFKRHENIYCSLLSHVRQTGDWKASVEVCPSSDFGKDLTKR